MYFRGPKRAIKALQLNCPFYDNIGRQMGLFIEMYLKHPSLKPFWHQNYLCSSLHPAGSLVCGDSEDWTSLSSSVFSFFIRLCQVGPLTSGTNSFPFTPCPHRNGVDDWHFFSEPNVQSLSQKGAKKRKIPVVSHLLAWMKGKPLCWRQLGVIKTRAYLFSQALPGWKLRWNAFCVASGQMPPPVKRRASLHREEE